MNGVIITTTINEPNEAIRQYDAMEDWNLIVVGDKNGPEEYELKRGRFIGWKEQQEKYPDLCSLIGARSTCRGRMIGLIEAHKVHPYIVATIDDDNIPYASWNYAPAIAVRAEVRVNKFMSGLCLDPIHMIGGKGVYHRGFPVELAEFEQQLVEQRVWMTPKLQANLWDGDPDVDAVIRIALKPILWVPPSWDYCCGEKFMPVNTQNTLIDGRYLRDFCPLPFIGRHEDIWAGYVFQQIHPDSTIYGPATVRHEQKRSIASLLDDLEKEIFGMKHGMEFLMVLSQYGPEVAMETVCPKETLEGWKMYRRYFE